MREGKKKLVTLIGEVSPGHRLLWLMALKGKERGHHLCPDPADLKEGIPPAHTGKPLLPQPFSLISEITLFPDCGKARGV